MEKRILQKIALGSGLACLLAEAGYFLGALPLPLTLVVLVAGIPVFFLSLFLWWSAKGKEGDIPFMGY